MRSGKLQVGLVGVGGIGFDQHLPGWAKVPFAEVTAVADLSQEALDRTLPIATINQRSSDWQQLVRNSQLDIIDICTPNQTHVEIALAALETGKHVLCEKPMATSVEGICRLRDAAQQSGKLLMAGQNLRFDPACTQIKSLIDGGMLGDIYYARAQWLRRRLVPPRGTFIEKKLSGGGPGWDLGIHILDLAYWFLGRPEPITVSGVTSNHLGRRADLSGEWGQWDCRRFDVEDFAAGWVRFASGAILSLEVSWLAFQPERELTRLQLLGTKAGAIWPDGTLAGETNQVPWDLKVQEPRKTSSHHEEIQQFALAIRNGLPSPVSVEDTLAVTRILEGLYQSAQQQREVVLK